jgi:hypothetical protein
MPLNLLLLGETGVGLKRSGSEHSLTRPYLNPPLKGEEKI